MREKIFNLISKNIELKGFAAQPNKLLITFAKENDESAQLVGAKCKAGIKVNGFNKK
tara:strand:+ start:2037 stop:2207 length:171 start_codon:yes stop_codon:yes gene_type:complete